MTNRLSYWNQTTNFLNQSQIGGRKNYSILNEIIELVHEIQIINQNKKIIFCLFWNIKRKFDYVNKKRLLKIINMTIILQKLFKWTKDFMKKREIQLKLDHSQNNLFDVNCGLFQKSFISLILWLIYVKYLHPEIKLKFKKNFMSYIDDLIIYVNGKNVKKIASYWSKLQNHYLTEQKKSMSSLIMTNAN